MRAAVVTPPSSGPWDEEGVAVSRFIGALACAADVDVLVAEGECHARTPDGAALRISFPAAPPDPPRRRALELIALGPPSNAYADSCDCLVEARSRLVRAIEVDVAAELVRTGGGTSPALLEHLASERYDLVIVAGLLGPNAIEAVRTAHTSSKVVLLPLARSTPALWLRAFDVEPNRIAAVAVATRHEARVAADRISGAPTPSVIGSVFRVHDLAHRNVPLLFEDVPVITVARDWRTTVDTHTIVDLARRLTRDLAGEAVVRLVGPGWELLPDDVRAAHAESRFDTWRWVVRSIAVWDPEPSRLIGREVLEAMMYGVPVIVPAHGGATREHAEDGNGGLWYRSYEELLAAARLLVRDPETRYTLGDQGRVYAEREYGDTDAYIERVAKLIESVL